MDYKKPVFTRTDLQNAITNLRPGMLGIWINRGVLNIADKAPGTGNIRLFNFYEALVVHIMSYLTLMDMSSAQAAAVGNAAAKEIEEYIRTGKPLDYTAIDEQTCPVLVWTFNSNGKLVYEMVPRDKLGEYPNPYFKDKFGVYYQILDCYYFAIGLEEKLA